MEKTCPGRQTSTSRIIEVKRRTREHDNIEEKAGEKTYFLHERHRADRETTLDYFLLRLNIWRREEKEGCIKKLSWKQIAEEVEFVLSR